MLPDLLFRIRAQGDTARAFAQTRGEVERTRSSLIGFGRAFAGGLGIGAGLTLLNQLPRTIAKVVDEASGLVNAADRIGMTTDQLQELSHTASLADVGFSELSGNLEQFSRRVADAGQGSGELLSLLNANGVALRDGNGNLRSQGELLAEVADLMANVASEQDQLNIAVMAFGRGGADMVNVLDGGSIAMSASGAEAHKLGKVLDGELLRRTEEIGDEWAKFTSGLGTEFKGAVLEIVTGAADIGAALDEMSDRQDSFLGRWIRGIETMSETGIPALPFGLRPTPDRRMDKMRTAMERGVDRSEWDPEKWLRVPRSGGTNIPSTDREEADREAERIQRVSEALAFQEAQFFRTAREREVYNTLQQAGIDASHSEAPAIMAAAGALYDLEFAFNRAVERADALRDAAGEFAHSFVQDLREGEGVLDSLGNAVDRLADRIISSGIDQLIAGLFGAAGTAGMGPVGSFIGSLLGFAQGGSVIAGGAGGPDSQIFAARVTPGERIDFTPPGGRGGGAPQQPIRIQLEWDEGGMFAPRVRQISGPLSQQISVAVVRENNRQAARLRQTHD